MIMALKLPDQLSVNHYHGLLICLYKTLPRIYHVSWIIFVGNGIVLKPPPIENLKIGCNNFQQLKKDENP